jgi:hypothetical protein
MTCPALRSPAFFLVTALAALTAVSSCRDPRSESEAPSETEAQARALGEGYTAVDIGAVAAAGTWVQSGASHTIEGSGADIWTAADECRFVYQTLPGDGTITARVTSLENTNDFAKAGVMMRESLAAGSKNVMALVTPLAANSLRLQFRAATNGTTDKAAVSGTATPPRWVRLVRSGSSFTAYGSTDGTTFTAFAPATTVSMTSTIFVGLAVTSHVDGTLATAVFDNVSITTPAPPSPPAAPANLVATAGNTQVGLSWSPSSGAASYTVKVSSTSGGPYSVVQPGVATTSYTHTGLTNGTTYYYVVSASNAAGEGPPSAQSQATPTLPAPPGAPPSLVATAGNTQVSLSWGVASGATSYTVRSSTSPGGPFSAIGPAVTTTSTTHTGLSNGTTYYYVVSASNAGGSGPDSAVASATPTAPPPPTFASQDIGTVGATGSWTQSGGLHTVKGAGADIYGTADAFRFAYQTITGDVTITARIDSLTTQNVWTKAVLMVREDLTAGSKNVATVVSPTATNKYRQQVRATTNGSSTTASSTANSAIPSYLRLERMGNVVRSYHGTSPSSMTLIATATVAMNPTVRVGLGVTSHVAGTLATGVFSNVTVVVPGPPGAPAGLTPTPGNNQVHLTWTATPGATSYTLKRGTNSGGPYALVQSGITDTQFTNTGLVNGTTYYFVLSASNPSGASADSAQVAGTPVLLRPSVRSVSPVEGATGVATNGFVSGDLIMPNVGGGVDASTLTATTVFLKRTSDGAQVTAALNTSGGGDVIVLQPHQQLDPQTHYDFTITAGLQDLTGAPFVPFTSGFTTGDPPPPPPTNIAFDQVVAADTVLGAKHTWTSVTIGPDNRLYAATIVGKIFRFPMNADGTLGAPTLIDTVRSNNGGDRALIGLTFDPAATSSNLILWVTHGAAALKEATDWSGKLTKLTGASLGTYQDVVVNFPRSFKDHMTNSIAFKAGEPSMVYIVQGSMNAMGAPDNAWGQRAEHLLSATVLRLDTTKLGTLPLNVQTNDADPTASGYNPFAANAPLIIYASGVRNAYDLVWHSNGSLYTATNGSAAGGSMPASPSPLPSACSRRLDGTPYTGPQIPGVATNPVAEDDFLYRVVQNGYYGHPNPSRCEWVLNGGNPTSGFTQGEVTAYPVGTQPDRNWRGASYTFGAHYSPNGTIEWKSNVFPSLVGKLMVIRYSGGDDIIVLPINATTKEIDGANVQMGITGMTGFTDPLDLTHNPATGHIYVTEHAGQRIVLLRPRL